MGARSTTRHAGGAAHDRGTRNSCVDSDGDMFWISYSNDLDTGSWEILEGTGKFEGMQGAGSVEFLLNLPDGRLVLAWDGSWPMQ